MRELALAYRRGGRSEKYQRDGEWGSFPADNVLALVEIAEAAWATVDCAPGYTAERGSIWSLDHNLDALRAALTRLDRPSDDGTADSGAAEEDRLARAKKTAQMWLDDEREFEDPVVALWHVQGRVLARDVLALVEIARTLEWYAERRNYVPAAPPVTSPPAHLMATDAWDGNGPGARARSALARLDSGAAEEQA